MVHRYKLLSSLDCRYYYSNKEIFDQLAEYLSEEAALAYNLRVELALLTRLAKQFSVDEQLVQNAAKGIQSITYQEVRKEEEKTNHHIRAVVTSIKKKIPRELRALVHLGATSHDIIETSTALRIRELSKNILIPLLTDLLDALIFLAKKELRTPQIGRTHGQFAVPITVGHFFAEYISRIGQSVTMLMDLVKKVPGKLSGAVGAYNAFSLIVKNPMKMEEEVLNVLGLPPSEYSKQICSPEPLLRLLLEYNIVFGILANLADDLRNLQRSEISEVQEFFSSTQVGSSTMPQKKNPWNSEHIKSLYKAFSPRIMTFFMDQISEHQRDLSNSASSRFISEYLSGFAAATQRSLNVIRSLSINYEKIKTNLAAAGDSVYTEALYVLLSLEGIDDAYKQIQVIHNKSKKGSSLISQLETQYPELWTSICQRLSLLSIANPYNFFSEPRFYIGYAVERSKKITAKYSKLVTQIRHTLGTSSEL